MVYHILFRRWPKYPAEFAFDMFTTLDDNQIVKAMSSICKEIHTGGTPADRAKPTGYVLPNSGTFMRFPGNRVFIYGVQREESAREIVRFLNEKFRNSSDHPHFAYIADSALSDADRQSMRQEADLVDRGQINVASLNRSDYAIAVLASLAAKDHETSPTLSKGSQATMPISSGSLMAMPDPEPYDDLESLPIKPEHLARFKMLPEPLRKHIRQTVKPDLLGRLFNIVDSQSTRTVSEKLILVIDILRSFKESMDSGRGLDSVDKHVFLNVACLLLWEVAAPAARKLGINPAPLTRWAMEARVENIESVCDIVCEVRSAIKAQTIDTSDKLPNQSDSDHPIGIAASDNSAPSPSDEIRRLEAETPPLDKGSGQWVKSTTAASLEGVEPATLAQYRLHGVKNADETLGRDRYGRIWRKPSPGRSHPWYLKRSLNSKEKIDRKSSNKP